MKFINIISFLIVILAAVNWAFIAFFQFNLMTIFAGNQQAMRITYAIVGVSALWWFFRLVANNSFRQSLGK